MAKSARKLSNLMFSVVGLIPNVYVERELPLLITLRHRNELHSPSISSLELDQVETDH
jgi:hypothetical protein